MKTKLLTITLVCIVLAFANSCKHEIITQPVDATPINGPVPNNGVCFETEVLPILKTNCAKSGCHDAATRQKGIVLDNYANIMAKGVVVGNAANSKIYKVLFETGQDKMPLAPNPDLTAAQKATIGKWINEGAKNTVNCSSNCDTTLFKYSANIQPILAANCVGCHSGAGASGGVNLSTYANVKAIATAGQLIGAITHAQGFSPMPKNGAKLPECQITQLKKWVAAGALNN
jgi:uncharacterized membrane protein